MRVFTIAIDGPVGAGKSSVADEVARRLGVLHLDTGAMYRAFAWLAIQEGVSLADEAALEALTKRALPDVLYEDGHQRTLIDGRDVTGFIRTPDISMAASTVSKAACVRAAMVERQQALARERSMVLDGRDIGTRVLPDATLKIYLTASPEARARRRLEDLQKSGEDASFEAVLQDVLRRDRQDMTREVDPLRPAPDAQVLDSSDMPFEHVVEDILRRIHLRLGHRPRPAEAFTPMYRVARVAAALLFNVITPIRYHRAEAAQMDAPYILIANHLTMLDPLIVALKCYRYHVRFLGKKELESNRIARWMFQKLLMIPVNRHNMDMAAMRACLKVLKEDHVLGIFPEGTRHHEGVMQSMETGIAMIALRAKVPLLPAYIQGRPKAFRRINVYFGDPIPVSEIAAKGVNKDTCAELMQRIGQTYDALTQMAGDPR